MKKTKMNLIIFIIVTLASGWVGVFVDNILTEQPERNTLGMGLWLILPFLTTIILRIVSKDKKDIGIKLNLKQNIKWYLLSFTIYPLVTGLTVGIGLILNCTNNADFKLDVFISLATFSILANLLKNIFEEFSWRGYLTPKLIDLRVNDWLIYVISGIVWSLWHTPYYFVFLPEMYFESTSRSEMFFSSIILMLCWTVMYTELYRLTKSAWSCVLLHAIKDAIPTVLVLTGGYITFTNGSDIWLNPINGIIANTIFIAIGLLLRVIRIKKEKESTSVIAGKLN